MSLYTCRVYKNTGFNSVNIPDSPALLDSFAIDGITPNFQYQDLPVLDLNQERFLPYVKVRCSWSDIKDADFCRIGDFFYAIDGMFMHI